MELKSGDKYQNIISQVVYTLINDGMGMWHLISHMGKGESCSEKEMIKFLKSRFTKIN